MERDGSIVTETLKNGITNSYIKRIKFNADFKYTSFIKFSLTRQLNKKKTSFFK